MRKATRQDDYALLGRTSSGDKVYLERGSFDCDWYFGFGYIKVFEENRSRWSSHLHWNSYFSDSSHVEPEDIDDSLSGKVEGKLVETPFSKKELWQLCDMMKSYYSLKETAGVYHRKGSSHLTGDTRGLFKNEELLEDLHDDTAHLIRQVQTLAGLKFPDTIENW